MSGPNDPAGVECEVVPAGELWIPALYAARPTGGPMQRLRSVLPSAGARCPCIAFIVRHPSAGVLLIDTGLHAEAVRSVRRDFGPLMGFFFAGLRPAGQPFDEQLRSRGVEPNEVTRVVMTHLHADHTSGMRQLPNAEFLITRAEWDAAHRRRAARRGYVANHLPDESQVTFVDFEAGNAERCGHFARGVDLFGDGLIRLLSTPGHTPGHMSVLLHLAGGATLLVVGDAAYSTRNIDEQVLPLITADAESTRRSLREIKAFADENREAWVIPSHDPSASRRFTAAIGPQRHREGASA